MTDRSNGYERVAAQFLAGRGSARTTGIGARAVRDWARTPSAGGRCYRFRLRVGPPHNRGPNHPRPERSTPLMHRHYWSRRSETISQRHPSPAKPWRTPRFRSDVQRCCRMGTNIRAFSRRTAVPHPENRRYNDAWWPPAVHVVRPTTGVERCDDGIGVTIAWRGRVPEAALSSWPVGD